LTNKFKTKKSPLPSRLYGTGCEKWFLKNY